MFTQTAASRIDLFAVCAFMHDYRITRRGHLRGLGNRGERMLRVAARSIVAGWFDMVFKLHCCISLFNIGCGNTEVFLLWRHARTHIFMFRKCFSISAKALFDYMI